MKRLYGDMESGAVYREMRSANLHNLPSEEHSLFSSMAGMEYNIRIGSGLATVQSAREPVSFLDIHCWEEMQILVNELFISFATLPMIRIVAVTPIISGKAKLH